VISGVYQTILEKAALDIGFDLPNGKVGEWLIFASSHVPLKIWIGAENENSFIVVFSDEKLIDSLKELGTLVDTDLPKDTAFALSVNDTKLLYPLLRRAFQLSRALPNEPLREFKKETQNLPTTTEVERLVVQRVGQDIFRSCLMDYWDGKCAVTGLAIPELLKASHIKPWRDCESDAERLDVFNGLLLSPNLDAAFDRGFISFDDEGKILFSPLLQSTSSQHLGLSPTLKIPKLEEQHKPYMQWHRERLFKKK